MSYFGYDDDDDEVTWEPECCDQCGKELHTACRCDDDALDDTEANTQGDQPTENE